MTQEDKQLLLADLCARLPYGVKINNGGIGKTVDSITIKPDYIEIVIKGTYAYSHFIHKNTGEWDNYDDLARCKPYLRPMSSMTEEEEKEFKKIVYDSMNIDNISASVYVADWLYSKHLDVHGLIPKGLAVEVTEENNPYKK